MFQSNSAAASLESRPISEEQAVLTFPEDVRRLTEEPEALSSSYGSLGQPDASIVNSNNNNNSSPAEELSGGTVLYLWVLAVVAVSGLVALFGSFRDAPGTVSLETDANFPFATTTKHPLRPNSLWGGVSRPYPTGAWWLNLAMGDGSFPVAPLPYSLKSAAYGVGVSYSAMRRSESLTRVQDAYATDLNVSATEGVTGHHVVTYDQLTVTLQHDVEGGGHFRTLAARGSPYMTFEYTRATPRITSNGDILEVNGEKLKVGASWHSDTFKLALSNWETWLVFTSGSVTWTLLSKSEVEIQTPFSGIVRVSMLPHPWDEESDAMLRAHAYAYPRAGKVAFDVTGDEVVIRYEWEKHGFGDLLMMALPHHMDTIHVHNADTIVMNNTYQTIKGPMTGIVGSTWEMRDSLTDIAWTARTPLSEVSKAINDPLLTVSWQRQVRKALAEDLAALPTAPDVYGFGKECARTARFALIADELGDGTSRDTALESVSTFLTPWMRNNNKDLLVYDKTWGGIVTKDGLNDQNADYGNAWYNDHTYHYGYVLYAAAVLIKFQPSFYTAYKEQVNFLVADVADNGRMPDLFPMARHKDFYAGHSWTSGLFEEANGKSQESVSESINAYYSVYLLGLATGDDDLRDWGRVLLAMEIRAARKYWQMPDGNGVYDSFFSSHRMVGMVASMEAVQLTWFGDNVEFVHCINMMPFTPITEELLQYEFMKQEWPVLKTAFDGRDPGPQWGGYVSLAGAVVLPLDAWANVTALSAFDSANSMTNSLYWIATRPQQDTDTGAYNESEFAVDVQIQPECWANSACNARGLAQHDCCPTIDGDMLGCCPSYIQKDDQVASACSANTGCVALDITTGLCCPTLAGEYLGCCDQKPETRHKAADVDPAALCSATKACSSLKGVCCPTEDGVYLGCCGEVRNTGDGAPRNSSEAMNSVEVTDDAACSRYPGCAGLEGNCCPTTPGGTSLACCG